MCNKIRVFVSSVALLVLAFLSDTSHQKKWWPSKKRNIKSSEKRLPWHERDLRSYSYLLVLFLLLGNTLTSYALDVVDNITRNNVITELHGHCIGPNFTYDVYWNDAAGPAVVEVVNTSGDVLASGATSPIRDILLNNSSTATLDIQAREQGNITNISSIVTVTRKDCVATEVNQTDFIDTATNATFTVPANITHIRASVIGGGGNGGRRGTGSGSATSGGGGGASAISTIEVVANEIFTVDVGAGRAGTNGAGRSASQVSSIINVSNINDSVTIVSAEGGDGAGQGSGTGGDGGRASQSIGQQTFSGGGGGNRSNNNLNGLFGHGGGAAHFTGNGGNSGFTFTGGSEAPGGSGASSGTGTGGIAGGGGAGKASFGSGGRGGHGARGHARIETFNSDVIAPTVTINQESSQLDPDLVGNTIIFTATFSEVIVVSSLDCNDVVITGTATSNCSGIFEVAPNDGTTFEIAINATTVGTVIASIPVASVNDVAGNNNEASTSIDNIVNVILAPGGVVVDLGLWLKADAGVTGGPAVSQWEDQGDGGINYAPLASNRSPDATVNTINFNPTVTFDGINDVLENNAISVFPDDQSTTAENSMYVVANASDNTPVFVQEANVQGVGPMMLGDGAYLRTRGSSFDSVDGGQTFDIPVINAFNRIAQSVSTFENGALQNSLSLTNGAATPTTISTVGGRDQGTLLSFDGDIAEIISYNHDTNSPIDRQRIESYLAIKYGITLDDTVGAYRSSARDVVYGGVCGEPVDLVNPIEHVYTQTLTTDGGDHTFRYWADTFSGPAANPALGYIIRNSSGTVVYTMESIPDGVVADRLTSANPDRNIVLNLPADTYTVTAFAGGSSEGTGQNFCLSPIDFWHDIASIGRDDAQALDQRVSKSVNSDALVTFALDNDFTAANNSAVRTTAHGADLSFMAWANNDARMTAWVTTNAPTGRSILPRAWKIDETGAIATVYISIPDDSSTLATKLPTEGTTVYLLTDTDTNFSDATETALTLNGTNWELPAGIDLADATHFTFATEVSNLAVNSIITATSPIEANATATSTITIQLVNAAGTALTTGGETIALETTGSAVLSAVVDNGDGTYTATLTNAIAETVTISAIVDNHTIADTADVVFQTGAPTLIIDPVASIVTATSPIEANGAATSTITVQLVDTTGTPLTASGGTITVTTTGDAVLSTVVDNGDGTYTVTAANGTAETVTISAEINGTEVLDTADVVFEVGAPTTVIDPVTSIVTATSPIEADGSATSTITVQLVDVQGTPLTASGGTVTVSTTGSAVLGTVVDNNDGTYTVTATNATEETVTISAEINGTEVLNTADVVFQIGAPTLIIDPVASIVTATSPIEADGTAISTITVQLVDTTSTPLTASGGTVTVSTTGSAVLGIVVDNNDGTYTVTATNATEETVTISAEINGT